MTEPYYDNSDPAQRFQPGTTVESSSVDYKFDEVATALGKVKVDTSRALKLPDESASQEIEANALQRRNKVVGFDKDGKLALLDGFTWRGDWTPNTDYFINDVVRDPDTKNLYVSRSRMTSGATFNAANWSLGVNVVDIENAKAATEAARDTTLSARDTTLAARDTTLTARDTTKGYRDKTLTARDTTLDYRNTAEEHKNSAANTWNLIRGAYYGALASDPTLDPLGNAPNAGDRYYNTTVGAEKVFNGSVWRTNDLDTYEVGTSSGVQLIPAAIDRRGIVFDTVADMQAFAGLQVGAKVRTLGYYSPGDGGGNDYEIVAAGTGTDDGGSFIDLSGSGLQAKGLFGSMARASQFGDSIADLILKTEYTNRLEKGGVYDLLSEQSLPADLTMYGAGSTQTVIRKTGTGTLFDAPEKNNISLSGFTIDMGQLSGNGSGHGIAASGSDLHIRDVRVIDYGAAGDERGTGILIAGGTGVRPKNVRLLDCDLIPNPDCDISVGWLFDRTDTSFASNMYAKDVKNGIGYAHELKNDARHNLLSSLIAENSNVALSYGQTTIDVDGADYNLAMGVLSKHCNEGVLLGEGSGNLFVGLLYDVTQSPNLNEKHAINLTGQASQNAVYSAISLGSPVSTVRYSGNNNFTEVCAFDEAADVVEINIGSVRNVTHVSHPGSRNSIAPYLKDESGAALRGSDANPVFCHATGERIGSLSGRFHDKLAETQANLNPSAHFWVNEGGLYSITSMAITGENGSAAGIAVSTPNSFREAQLLYNCTETSSNDFWSLRANSTNSLRFYDVITRPEVDGVHLLGTAANRFSELYASTGTINTSDKREKQDIECLDEAELLVAKRLKGLVKKFRYRDAVDRKGSEARIHIGVIAQEVAEAFAAEGLDANRYGIICYDEWEEQPEVKDEDGNITQEYRSAGNRYGVRYEELLAFIIAAL